MQPPASPLKAHPFLSRGMCASLLILLVTLAPLDATAQARPDCPTRPQTLAQMRGCFRPLLVFSPSAADPRLAAQRDALDRAADDMMDRNVLLVPILSPTVRAESQAPSRTKTSTQFQPPLDAPYTLLGQPEAVAARARYQVALGSFAVLLLGEDGGAKLHSSVPVSADRLNDLIDGMPSRKLEMQRPHTN